MANIKKVLASGLTRAGTFIADVPDTPIIGTATDVGTSRPFNNGAATITATPSTGGIPTSYNMTSSPGSYSASGTSPVTVTGLQSSTSYTFTATATGGGYTTGSSSSSNSITATTVPDVSTIGTATNVASGRAYNNGRADITFTPTVNTGGKTITLYTMTSSPGGFTGTGTSSPITVTGLQSATSYTFTVTSTNANGTSLASSSSNSITATTVPQAPTIGVTLAYPNFTMTFSGSTGGSAITSYEYSTNGGTNWKALSGTTSPQTISTQSNNSSFVPATSYTFTLRAINTNGTSLTSNSVSLTYAGAPGIPGSITANNTYTTTGGQIYTKVTWTAAADNGASITGYTVTASPGGASQTVSGATTSATFTTLTPGTLYTFSVYATNVVGNGTAGNSNSRWAVDVGWEKGSIGVSTAATSYSDVQTMSAENITNRGSSCMFWRGAVDGTSVSADVRSRLINFVAGIDTALQTFNMEPQDTTDVMSTGGMVALASGFQEFSSFKTQVSSESTSATAEYANSAILRLRLGSGSSSVRKTSTVTTTSPSAVDAESLSLPTLGFGSDRDYLVILSAEVNLSGSSNVGEVLGARQTFNTGTGQWGNTATFGSLSPVPTVDTTNYSPYFHIEKISRTGGISSSERISLQMSTTGGTLSVRNMSIMLLDLTSNTAYYYAAPTNATTTSTSYTTGGSTTFSITNPGNAHLVLASAMLGSGSTSLSATARLAQGSMLAVTRESNTTSERYPMITFDIIAGTTSTYNWEFLAESGATANIRDQRICLIDLGFPNAEIPA
jgi:hypothetical protein